MNKSSLIRKLGAILQTKKATKEEVKEAYENSGVLHYEDIEKAMVDIIDPMKPIIEQVMSQIRIEEEDQVLRAVRDVNVIVDKERLVQALTDANAFYKEGYMAAMHMNRWISLEEQKPPKSGSYLITTKNGAVCTAHWYGEKFSSPAGKNAEYWMPMPEPPNE